MKKSTTSFGSRGARAILACLIFLPACAATADDDGSGEAIDEVSAESTAGAHNIFGNATPAQISSDASANELGLKFKSDVAGRITAIRFYKGAGNGGTHVGHLWTSTGTLLGSVTFTNESATGWQIGTLASPVSIQANTVYVVSYYAPQGHYATTPSQFASASFDNAPLHALQDGAAGPNSVYARGASAFPINTYRSTNYWVDVVFTANDAPPPCTGVAVAPGEDIQAKLNAGGTAFCLKAGIHRITTGLTLKNNQTLRGEPGAIVSGARIAKTWTRSGSTWYATGLLPAAYTGNGQCEDQTTNPCRLGEEVFFDNQHLTRVMSLSALGAGKFYEDYAANRVYVASDPTGHLVEVARTQTAITAGAAGMVIERLTFEKFATPAQQGAVIVRNGAVVRNCEVRFNHGVGIMAQGAGSQVVDNNVHHNGQLGVSGHRNSNLLVKGNELAWNNTDGFYIADWEAGGIKITWTSATIQDNHVHHNKALGVWVDIDNRDVTIENNRIIDNATDGIRYEISYDGVIRNNVITGNGFGIGRGCNNGDFSLFCVAGISLNTSMNVEVYGNEVRGNIHGIGLQWRNRGSGELGLRDLKNVYVHDNTITLANGQLTGVVQLQGDGSVFTSKNNRFVHNTYHLDSLTARKFAWQNAYRTKEQWKGYGQDVDGTFLSP